MSTGQQDQILDRIVKKFDEIDRNSAEILQGLRLIQSRLALLDLPRRIGRLEKAVFGSTA